MVLPKKNINEKKFQLVDEDLSKQYMLFLLAALNEKPIKNKINLMEMLFFISLNIPQLEQEFNFEADNYGPSSDVVNRNLEYLIKDAFLTEDKQGYKLYKLGKEYLNLHEFDNIDLELIEDMKKLFDGLNSEEVCALTYFTFPETTTESLIRNRIIENREKIAVNLFKKNKISVEKASEIAGLHLKEFTDLLYKKNIKIKLML